MKINSAQKCLAKKAELLQSNYKAAEDMTIFELSLEFSTPLIILRQKQIFQRLVCLILMAYLNLLHTIGA